MRIDFIGVHRIGLKCDNRTTLVEPLKDGFINVYDVYYTLIYHVIQERTYGGGEWHQNFLLTNPKIIIIIFKIKIITKCILVMLCCERHTIHG